MEKVDSIHQGNIEKMEINCKREIEAFKVSSSFKLLLR